MAGNIAFDARQLREYVVRPVLVRLNLWSLAAENLVVGTAVHESRLDYLKQLGRGPALGICQMEPATHDDIWQNYLAYHPGLASRVEQLIAPWPVPRSSQLVSNLAYAVGMCRVHYRRVPTALPKADDTVGLGAYWKTHYNTHLGAGTIEQFVEAYSQA